jgi:hypothetical protein
MNQLLPCLSCVIAALAMMPWSLLDGVVPSRIDPAMQQSEVAQPREEKQMSDDDAWTVKRVGGDMDTQPERVDDDRVHWRCGRSVIEAPLPEGYPAPTPPGAIEIKKYPSVRRAEFVGRGDNDSGRNGAFWPLFQHIKQREIAMTSPVEMDYDDSGEWTMSFLYRTADLGPTGTDGNVRVVDTEPVTVISIGLRGPYGMRTIERGLEQLQQWLDGQSEWKAAGDPRSFYYNGPYVPNGYKWAEAQIPVQREDASAEASAGPSDDPAADAAS